LLDALNALSGDSVVFCFNGKLDATMMRDPAAEEYLHIIMPLKS
jgi:DNA polymerase III sliding clamp (beta) subunit (PCNA family)